MRATEQTFASGRRGRIGFLATLMLITGLSSPARAQYWVGYGGNAQHTALVQGPSQVPQAIRWSAPVDLDPQYSGDELLIHYGSPAITAKNTVIFPVKMQAQGVFEVLAVNGTTGQQMWSFATDYVLPSHNWVPPVGITLLEGDTRVMIPGAGGTVWARNSPNTARGSATRLAFYGIKNYNSSPDEFNTAIQICTPISADNSGNIYFGYLSSGVALPGYPNGIPSGLARIDSTGNGSYVSASVLANSNTPLKITYNCTPALTTDGSKVYVSVNQYDFSSGYLCVADAATLTPINQIFLEDAKRTGQPAVVPDDGTASPTIGPDGDVYIGVLENGWPSANHDRGWLLHYDSGLTTVKIPGAFGWDDSASIVPASLVSSYTGNSSYLVLTKYNNYSDPGIGGNGENMVAVLDPNTSMVDPISKAHVMATVITVLGPTKNPNLPGVDEWCINSAAIDTVNKCAVINSEDGHVYRWDFTTNTLSTGLQLAPPTGEAYTPTLIGPDGAVYAINNAKLFCCEATADGIPRHRTGGLFWIDQIRAFATSAGHAAIWTGIACAFALYHATKRLRRACSRPVVMPTLVAGSA